MPFSVIVQREPELLVYDVVCRNRSCKEASLVRYKIDLVRTGHIISLGQAFRLKRLWWASAFVGDQVRVEHGFGTRVAAIEYMLRETGYWPKLNK